MHAKAKIFFKQKIYKIDNIYYIGETAINLSPVGKVAHDFFPKTIFCVIFPAFGCIRYPQFLYIAVFVCSFTVYEIGFLVRSWKTTSENGSMAVRL